MSRRTMHSLFTVLVAASSLFVIRMLGTDAAQPSDVRLSEPSPSPTLTAENDWLVEPVHTNYPVPSLSERGNHCPSFQVPAGSVNTFDPETGRLEIDFYDAGRDRSRQFILDVRDPACFEQHVTRQALFIELALQLQIHTTDEGFAEGCAALRRAIRSGSLKLGEVPFDLTPAQPFEHEVCRQ